MREDWIECKLRDLVQYSKGKKPSNLVNEKIDNDYKPYINIKAFEKGIIDEYSNDVKANYCVDGDLLMVWDGARAGLVGKAKNGVIGSTLMKIEPKKDVHKELIFYYLKSLFATINTNTKGVGIPHVEPNLLWDSHLLFFPLPEQRAIVKKLESLFSSLDAGVADLKKAQQQLKIYRQAVLKKAFEGEFTEEWRSKQNDLPSNDEILALAKNERSKYYHLQLNEWEEAVKDWKRSGSVDKKPIKPSKPKEFDVVKSDELETYDLGEAVKNWSRIGNLTYKVGDIDHKMPSTVADGIPYLSTGNIGKNGGLDFENAKRISEADYKRLALKIKPEKGDIIFPRYGTIGRNILIDIDKKFLVSYSCAIIKTLKEVYSPKFLLYYTLSPIIQKEIKRYTVETTQKNIGIASIERFICPIYSLLEQQQIIKEVESRLSVCDSIEQNIKESLVKAEALRQSILKKAFEGNLLTAQELAECKQAADYEPASVLLQRIRNEKLKIRKK